MTKASRTALRGKEMHGSGGAPWPSRARASLLAPVVLLFVGSGSAALIYQVVWLQLLSLVIGSSAISLGLLLATFMAGMCIGSLGLPYVVSRRRLTTLVPENPRSVLVIGFGAGATAGAVSLDPRVEDLTIAEIEHLVPGVVSTYFSRDNFNVARNPKTTIVVDDARHFLLTTDKTFDAITSDPFDPWVEGAANLYTAEFLELMKQRLNPGSVVTIFVQLYESGLEAVKSEIATFVQAFPNSVVWANSYFESALSRESVVWFCLPNRTGL